MQDDIKTALEVLQKGGTILYPTDTIWGIGCDATNAKAVEKVYKIKYRSPQNSLILLANSPEMISKYVVEIPDLALEIIQSIKDPITIIYGKVRNLAKNLIPSDGTIAIRIPRDEFCLELINAFGKPITSTSANLSGDPNPLSFGKVNQKIKDEVDYVCTSNHSRINAPKPSIIVKINEDGQMQIIRN